MAQLNATLHQPVLHLRIAGHSTELPLAALRLDAASPDARIKQAVAAHLELPLATLDDYVIVRHAHAIVVRPEAVYG